VEVRVVAPDDIPLSSAEGRATGYIAVHVYQGTPYDAYFQGVERIMDSYGGRPHWGKMHFQGHEDARRALPALGRVPGGARRLDPDGRFTNPYLQRVPRPLT
jgi:L-gulonolactone oxidase